MEDGYWDLFWRTGAPEFYLMKKGRQNGEPPEEPEEDVVQPVHG